jgi:hypothetical protein
MLAADKQPLKKRKRAGISNNNNSTKKKKHKKKKNNTSSSITYRTSTSRYANRTTKQVVLRRLKDSKQKFIIALDHELVLLEQEYTMLLAKSAVRPIVNLYDFKDLQVRLGKVSSRIASIRSGAVISSFDARISQLSNLGHDKNARHGGAIVYLSRLLGTETELLTTDEDRCRQCGRIVLFNATTFLKVCASCRVVKKVITVAEDSLNDAMLLKAARAASVSVTFEKNAMTTLAPSESPAARKKTKTTLRNTKVESYGRFLLAFDDNAPVIPNEVLDVVYHNLCNVNLLTEARCQSSTVVNILRSADMTGFIVYAPRIACIFNGVEVPLIDAKLRDELVSRFVVLLTVAEMGTVNKKKVRLPAFEQLTHVLLVAAGRKDMATFFELHRTRGVLNAAKQKITKLFQECAKHDEGKRYSWNMNVKK